MKKKFTEKQMAFLATQERDMRTAVESNWSRYPGQANIEQMRKIWEELTGQTREIRLSCSSCILNLVRDMGILYFAQKKEQEADLAAAAAKAAKAAEEAAAMSVSEQKKKRMKDMAEEGKSKKKKKKKASRDEDECDDPSLTPREKKRCLMKKKG